MQDDTMRRLAGLHGAWSGKGSGDYATIEPFEYEESLRFEIDPRYPLIHYEQRTLLLPSREPSHWESGFIRAVEDGAIEISNSQNSGRVEVLRGRLAQGGDGMEIVFDSVALGHDPRLLRTGRTWALRGDTLRYEVRMATRTTDAPRFAWHLRAVLTRSS